MKYKILMLPILLSFVSLVSANEIECMDPPLGWRTFKITVQLLIVMLLVVSVYGLIKKKRLKGGK